MPRRSTPRPSQLNKAPKQAPKTREQLLEEAAMKKEVKRTRAIITEQVYPILLKASKNIPDAIQFLAVLNMGIRQQFNNQMRTQKIGDLKLLEAVDPKADRVEYYKQMIELIKNETVGTGLGLMEGLGNEIERLIKKENAERSLATLKTDFIE